ncbi:MAG: hypothetical protein EOO92_10195 [Pedobacter sp.]|nr:MAG: hypothetical protein EOO92_10195 [Pedobacter sp.]
MKRKLLLSCLLAVASYTAFSQTAFTAGSISVLRVGDGSGTLGTSAAPVFIDEYSTSGTLIRSLALPTTVVGANRRLTLDGNTSSVSSFEGLLSLSQDGQKLTLAGFDAPVNTTTITSSLSATYNRVVGVIDGTGNVNTTTALDIYSGVLVSSAVAEGNNLWISGGNTNIYHTTIGATTATSIISRTGRSMRIFNNQLYASQTSGTFGPVITIGSGLPTTTAQVAAGLPGMPTATPSTREFFFADVNPAIPGNDVLYVVNAVSSEGIAKYSLVGGNWVPNGIITGQYTGLTGVVSGTTVTLYGVRFATSANKIFKITDATGYNVDMTATATDIATAAANTVFRGLSLSPQVTTNPVSLISFTGKEAANGVRLNWSTASELNNSHFEIYRSIDEQSFIKLGVVKGAGTANEDLNYSFTDISPLSGTAYYKLRQVDFDGRSAEYGPIPVKSGLQKNEMKVQVKENSVQVSLFASANSTTDIYISDISGHKLTKLSAAVNSGWNNVEVPFTANKGVYVIFSKNGSEINKKKFVK